MKESRATSTPLHRFDASRAIEAKWEVVLDRLLRESYPLSTVEPVSLAEEFRGVDRYVIDDQGERVKVEYKFDERWRTTGNIFVETVSNDTTSRPGWAFTCTADWLLYFCTPSRVLMFDVPTLRLARDRWAQRYQVRAALNAGYRTLGICVPLRVAERAAECVLRLDHGDGVVFQRRDRHDDD